MEKTFEIDIKRLLLELLSNVKYILLAAIVLAAGGYLYAKTQLTPIYTAKASIYVNNYASAEQRIQKTSTSDLYAAQALVPTYLIFLKSDRVLDEVASHFDGAYTTSQIRGMMSASALNETEIFQIQVSCSDPQMAAEIANVIADMAPGVIMDYIEGSSVKVVDYAKVPQTRSFPVYRKYVVYGGMIGGGIAAIIFILMSLFNTQINTEEDLNKLFTAPVIGRIPNFEQCANATGAYAKKYKYGYGYASKEERK